jgi:hypothetical protein
MKWDLGVGAGLVRGIGLALDLGCGTGDADGDDARKFQLNYSNAKSFKIDVLQPWVRQNLTVL